MLFALKPIDLLWITRASKQRPIPVNAFPVHSSARVPAVIRAKLLIQHQVCQVIGTHVVRVSKEEQATCRCWSWDVWTAAYTVMMFWTLKKATNRYLSITIFFWPRERIWPGARRGCCKILIFKVLGQKTSFCFWLSVYMQMEMWSLSEKVLNTTRLQDVTLYSIAFIPLALLIYSGLSGKVEFACSWTYPNPRILIILSQEKNDVSFVT